MKPDVSDAVVTTVDEAGQINQVVQLVKENKMMTALVVFICWQTGLLLEAYSHVQGGIC